MRRWRREIKPLLAISKQPENFFLAAQKYKGQPGYTVRYSHRKQSGEIPQHVQDIPLEDTLKVAKTIESFISSQWGGGVWKAEFMDANNRPIATYTLNISGTLYNVRTGRKAAPDDDLEGEGGRGRKRSAGASEELIARVAEKHLMKEDKDPMEAAAQLVTMISQMTGGSSKMEDLMTESFAVQINNGIAKQENIVSQLKEFAELQSILAPKLPAEDMSTALINAIPQAISAYMMLKGAGNPPPALAPISALHSGGNGGVDMNALRSLAQSMPDDLLPHLPADQREVITQLRSTGVALPRPGDPETIQPAQPAQPVDAGGDSGVLSTPPGSPPAPPPPVAGNPYFAAIDAMVEEIRDDLRKDGTDREVAEKILSMVATARGFTSKDPHPLLAGIMNASVETGATEFQRFCAAIPELRSEPERIDRIGMQLVEVMQAGAASTLESIEYETEEEEEEKIGTEATEDDVSGSTRLPGEQPPAGTDESDTDGEQVQQRDEPLAEAV